MINFNPTCFEFAIATGVCNVYINELFKSKIIVNEEAKAPLQTVTRTTIVILVIL